MNRVCVFCGSSSGEDARYLEAAAAFGDELLRRGLGLVYGGSRMGLMGRLAETMLEGDGEVIGVMPKALMNREVAHQGLTELRIVESMHERKATMVELGDAFVALPGGLGTLEEFLEVVTWAQLGFHRKPCGLLNIYDFYGPLADLLDHGTREGFIGRQHRDLVQIASDPARLMGLLAEYRPPELPRWIGRKET